MLEIVTWITIRIKFRTKENLITIKNLIKSISGKNWFNWFKALIGS